MASIRTTVVLLSFSKRRNLKKPTRSFGIKLGPSLSEKYGCDWGAWIYKLDIASYFKALELLKEVKT